MAIRTATAVLRDMQLIRSAVADPVVREALLQPLQWELEQLAEEAKRKAQPTLPLNAPSKK